MDWLKLPPPYPQIAEALFWDCDELAETALEAALIHGLSVILADTKANRSFCSTDRLQYCADALDDAYDTINVKTSEQRKIIRTLYNDANRAPF